MASRLGGADAGVVQFGVALGACGDATGLLPVAAVQAGRIQQGSAEVAVAQVGADQQAAAQVRPPQGGPRQAGVAEVGPP